ncbi:phosphatidylinositol mannoside acyltransferase [Tsukamurella tyrosinosolvens]|uniref:phosphatidylinositol mannoside acyltransferase n=1 Tax=Tsukamurella tyrosinosolvens TaxID=57704 RepID=UPI001AF8C234|nr:phosphatidylinositol mannoside acyltransferase [Tsukamurella tyrosinosolvens]QRY86846.1 phosphatidylinositol mannoside acyltransferase [Tsukamurella tyrosinosolvens]
MDPREEVADLAYRTGWAVTKRMPESAAKFLIDDVGGRIGARGDNTQLRKNLARVLGTTPDAVPQSLIEESSRSYARYWRESFRLPSMDLVELGARLDQYVDVPSLHEAMDAGTGAVLALPHSGNWDMAGVWLVQKYGRFATVAERLKPESLFRRFVEYRESLGFEIFPLSGGEQPPMQALGQRLREGRPICLLGERDLARHGVPVTFFGESTRMPAGPAKLAIDTGAPLLPVHCWFEGDAWGFKAEDPIDVSGGIESATQKLAHAFERNIAQHPADWHMLQPLWEADWSQARRDRILGDPADGAAGEGTAGEGSGVR